MKNINERYYEKQPSIIINKDIDVWKNKSEIMKVISLFDSRFIIIETYPGVNLEELRNSLIDKFGEENLFHSESFAVSEEKYLDEIKDDLTEDRIFGRITERSFDEFFDKEKIAEFVNSRSSEEQTIIYGVGSYLFSNENDTKVYFDLERWEAQLRYRRGENIFFLNGNAKDKLHAFKRGYFIEWRMADKIKKERLKDFDYYVDSNEETWSMLKIEDYFDALSIASKTPFRLQPYFDLGVWGGSWMNEVCDLGADDVPMAWGFDGVPEENSLNLDINGTIINTPAINMVFFEPENLLGQNVINKFGYEFPIRFDFLDTIGGQNLSLQVHPFDEYAKEKFNINYSQNESYYYIDANEDAEVYLGLKDGIKTSEFIEALEESRITGKFDSSKYVNSYPVKKHDHILHPSGVIHSSGSGGMVLEISSTPYIFTFKLWDWDRVDLDGKPREINIEHAKSNIKEESGRDYNKSQYVNRFEDIYNDEQVKITKTGLHETQFIETNRFEFEDSFILETGNTVNMLNLVDGDSITIQSVDGSFQDIIINYVETFIIPANIGKVKVKNNGERKALLLRAKIKISK